MTGLFVHLNVYLIYNPVSVRFCCSFEKYFVMCSLTHNGKTLFKPVQSKRVGTYRSFFYHVKWDEL